MAKCLKMKYDLCIDISHIHNKKWIWKIINILIKYRKIFNENPICVMPGSVYKYDQAMKIINILKEKQLNVFMPGIVNKSELYFIYNYSKYFIYLGDYRSDDLFEMMSNEEIATELYYKIKIYDIKTREKLYNYYEKNVGVETVILPNMKKLFESFKKGS